MMYCGLNIMTNRTLTPTKKANGYNRCSVTRVIMMNFLFLINIADISASYTRVRPQGIYWSKKRVRLIRACDLYVSIYGYSNLPLKMLHKLWITNQFPNWLAFVYNVNLLLICTWYKKVMSEYSKFISFIHWHSLTFSFTHSLTPNYHSLVAGLAFERAGKCIFSWNPCITIEWVMIYNNK